MLFSMRFFSEINQACGNERLPTGDGSLCDFSCVFCNLVINMSLDSKEITLNFIEDYHKLEVLWKTDLKEYYNKLLRGDCLQKLSEKSVGK